MIPIRIVETCERMPHHCAITLQADCKDGFIDTGVELPCIDPAIYLSVAKVREYARELGMVDGDEYAALAVTVDSLEHSLAAKQDELDAVNAELDAISVIESSDRFKARRKPGPKKKVAA